MLMKKLLWTACAAIALTASAGINAEEYVVGTGATYRPFEYETCLLYTSPSPRDCS